MAESARQRFLKICLSKSGKPYIWPDASNGYSGKGHGGMYDGYDCSGLVTSSMFEAGGFDMRTNYNAQALYDKFTETKNPIAGDLCFYGATDKNISHVMVLMDGGRVFGASGGNSDCNTPEVSANHNANVRYQSGPHYRPDFRGYRRLPL